MLNDSVDLCSEMFAHGLKYLEHFCQNTWTDAKKSCKLLKDDLHWNICYQTSSEGSYFRRKEKTNLTWASFIFLGCKFDAYFRIFKPANPHTFHNLYTTNVWLKGAEDVKCSEERTIIVQPHLEWITSSVCPSNSGCTQIVGRALR